MERNLDDEIKRAELLKLLAETKKIYSEKSKIDCSYQTKKKRWYTSGKYWSQLVIIITLLGFYINFAVIPASNIANTRLELENLKKEKNIFDQEQHLAKLSVDLHASKNLYDSLNFKFIMVSKEKNSLDSSYRDLRTARARVNNSKSRISDTRLDSIDRKIENTLNLLNKYNETKKESSLHFIVTEEGKPASGYVFFSLKILDKAPIWDGKKAVSPSLKGNFWVSLGKGKYLISVFTDGYAPQEKYFELEGDGVGQQFRFDLHKK